jgi:hypothetical protein
MVDTPNEDQAPETANEENALPSQPSENLPTVNDTDVQTDLPEATDDSQERQEASDTEKFMVTLGGRVYAVEAKDSTEAGKKARKLYDKDTKETK